MLPSRRQQAPSEAEGPVSGHVPGLDARLLEALWAIEQTRKRLVLEEARRLLRLFEADAAADFGYSGFHDFAREKLELSSRTVSRRLGLARATARSALVETAFLSGRLSVCQVLALRPVLDDPALPFWIARAQGMTVRELTSSIKQAPPPSADDDSEHENLVRVSFPAPLSVHLSLDHALHRARQVIGFDAPRYRCFEAILAEAGSALGHDPEGDDGPPRLNCAELSGSSAGPPVGAEEGESKPLGPTTSSKRGLAEPGSRAGPPGAFRPLSGSVARARVTLRRVEAELEDIESLLDPELEATPDGLLSLRVIARIERPLRVLRSRLLCDLYDTRALRRLGYDSLADLARRELKLSERSSRNLLKEGRCFDDEPGLETAYATGRIGLAQVSLLRSVVASSTVEDWLHRAARVTVQQLSREVALMHRAARLWAKPPLDLFRPFPGSGLVSLLVGRLAELGVREEAPEAEGDPARDPAFHRWLESLVDRIVLEEAAREEATLDRCKAAATVGERGSQVASNPANVGEPDGGSGECPGNPAFGSRFSPVADVPPERSLHLLLPENVFRQWRRLVNHLGRPEAGYPRPPQWVILVLVVQAALHEWEQPDPARVPREVLIYSRDDYACQAPGCTRRRNLEAHHIVYRSRSGNDDPSNKTTLCAFHHRQGEHGTSLQVRGRAPASLRWVLGDTKPATHQRPWQVSPECYVGHLKVTAPSAGEDAPRTGTERTKPGQTKPGQTEPERWSST